MTKAAHTPEVLGIHGRILQASTAEEKKVIIGDSCHIHVLEAGEGAGPPLV